MSTLDAIAKKATSPLGLVVLGGVAFLIITGELKSWISGLFGQNGAYNPENNATDAAGNPVNEYKQVGGVLGYLGASANAASGGLLASFGEWIGGGVADLTCNYNPNAQPVAIGDSTVSTDPVSGVLFEDSFRRASTRKSSGSIPTSNQFKEVSGAIQSWSARPYQSAPNAAYKHAYDTSPPDPQYSVNVLVARPTMALKGK